MQRCSQDFECRAFLITLATHPWGEIVARNSWNHAAPAAHRRRLRPGRRKPLLSRWFSMEGSIFIAGEIFPKVWSGGADIGRQREWAAGPLARWNNDNQSDFGRRP